MLLVDEADNIMQFEFDVLRKILLQGREFGVGVVLASQYLSHFKTKHENYAENLLSWFIHKVPNVKAAELNAIGLSNASTEMANRIKDLELFHLFAKTLDVEGEFAKVVPFFELLQNVE